MQIVWDASIPMDDGVVLRADVFRPSDDSRRPVILSYGPYAKGLSFQEGYKSNWARLIKAAPEVLEGSSNKYQCWELVDPEKWVPDGYVCVRVDSRGAGRSHGVGERGTRSVVTGEPVAGPETLAPEVLAKNTTDPAGEALRRTVVDDYYRSRMVDFGRIEAPLLSAANWGGQGLHPRGNYEGFLAAGSKEKWLEVHGDTHFTHFYSNYGMGLQKRFFGRFLKNADTGWDQQPRVSLNIRRPSERFTLRAENEWPIARTQWTKFFLHPELTLSHREPDAAKRLTYEATGEGLTFSTPPARHELEITGPV